MKAPDIIKLRSNMKDDLAYAGREPQPPVDSKHRLIASVTCLIGLVACVTSSSMVQAQSRDDAGLSAESVILKIEQRYSQLTDFSAEFEQTVVRAHLPDRPLKRKGKVYFKKPGLMRWDYEEPDKVYYVSDGNFLWNYIPEAKLAYKLKIKDSELYFALRFLYGEGKLTDEFLPDSPVGIVQSGVLELVLKPKKQHQPFTKLTLLIDPNTYEILATVVVDPTGNTNTIRFVKRSFKPLPAAGFKFTPPKGVKVEDLSAPRPDLHPR